MFALMDPQVTAGRPQTRDDVVFRQLDEEWVIFDPSTDRLHALNLSAALVWTHCTGELDVRQIAAAVADAFDPPMSVTEVLADVEAAVARFRSEGLLVPSPSSKHTASDD
jgi:hypothetical protein